MRYSLFPTLRCMPSAAWGVAIVLVAVSGGHVQGKQGEGQVAGDEKPRGAYVGVGIQAVPDQLCEQLGLAAGVGIVVTQVAAQSPCVNRILPDDVLVELGDQILVNAHQFAVLVRMHDPGDEITLTLFRHGAEMVVPVVLGEKELTPLSAYHRTVTRVQREGGAGAAVTRTVIPNIRIDATAGRGGVGADGENHVEVVVPEIRIETMQENGAVSVTQIVRGSTKTWSASISEKGQTASLAEKDGKRWFSIADVEGKISHELPVDTEQERAAVPEAYRALFDRLWRHVQQ